MDLGAAWRAFATYQGAAPVTRAFVAARFLVAPLGPLEAQLAGCTGTVLSLGSGLCMVERYLSETNPNLTLVGVDLDADKAELIDRTKARSPRVSLRVDDATALSEARGYDAVLLCDAIHHFPQDTHDRVARTVADALVPGGVALVKDLDVAPRWKYHWNRFHDRLVAGPEPIWCRSPTELAEVFVGAGLTLELAERLDHAATPYAHYLLRLRKPHP
jgi:SAM-dependent methyltransferase